MSPKHIVFDIVGTLITYTNLISTVNSRLGPKLLSKNITPTHLVATWFEVAEREYAYLSIANAYAPFDICFENLFYRTLYIAGIQDPRDFASAEDLEALMDAYRRLDARKGARECVQGGVLYGVGSNAAYLPLCYYEDFYPGKSSWYPGEMGDDDPIPDEHRSLVCSRLPASFYAVPSPTFYPGPIDETSMDEDDYDLSPEDNSVPFENAYNEAPESSSTLYQNTHNANLEHESTSHENAYNGTTESSYDSYQNTEYPESVSNPYENFDNEDLDNWSWSASYFINSESHGNASNPYENFDNEVIESGHIQYGNSQNQGLENASIPNTNLYQPPDNAYSRYQRTYNQQSYNPYTTTIGVSYNQSRENGSVLYKQGYNGGIVSQPVTNNRGPTFDEVRETIKQDIHNTAHSEVNTMIYGPMYPEVGYDMAHNIANYIKHTENIKAHVHFNSWTAKFEIRKMTNISETIGEWFRLYMDRFHLRQSFTQSEFTQLEILEGELTEGFAQPYYHQSVKQPFLQVRTRGQEMPQIVIEIGWNESIQRMREDVSLWGDGSYSTVQVVILVHFTFHPDDQVQGSLEVWRPRMMEVPDDGAIEYRRNGMQLAQAEPIFPEPQSRQRDAAIYLTRGELFGSAMAPSQDPKDVFEFYMNELQDIVEAEIRAKELQPLENGQTDPGDGEN
ncbi:hypothetical protein N8T08_000324 [Aspergillus melleus]|uniref:Uncharacterized protein n=1 Tax=Aspergillus melleus TaxID=138277 RepID=A0ACC3BB39_9EURO|nr:hypothetical protein N8T08_000324 [Aspergillus melleus]